MASRPGPEVESLLDPIAPFVPERHRTTVEVLAWMFRTGRQIDAWLSETLRVHDAPRSCR